MSKTDEAITRLRADLMATNAALLALLRAMPVASRQHALDLFAEMSAQKQQLVERTTNAEQRLLLQQIQAAEDRLFQGLQGAHRVQAAAERS